MKAIFDVHNSGIQIKSVTIIVEHKSCSTLEQWNSQNSILTKEFMDFFLFIVNFRGYPNITLQTYNFKMRSDFC